MILVAPPRSPSLTRSPFISSFGSRYEFSFSAPRLRNQVILRDPPSCPAHGCLPVTSARSPLLMVGLRSHSPARPPASSHRQVGSVELDLVPAFPPASRLLAYRGIGFGELLLVDGLNSDLPRSLCFPSLRAGATGICAVDKDLHPEYASHPAMLFHDLQTTPPLHWNAKTGLPRFPPVTTAPHPSPPPCTYDVPRPPFASSPFFCSKSTLGSLF